MRISDETKRKQGRGTGTGANYKPWIKASEINSRGTASSLPDFKNGRMVELLSQGEVWWWYSLRWMDFVEDIREQFPLNPEVTGQICQLKGYIHPGGGDNVMTTDLLVTHTDGTYKAYSVKADQRALDNPRTLEKLDIEKIYWMSMGIPYEVVFKNDLDRTTILNLQDVLTAWNEDAVFDDISRIKHMIARKRLVVDLSKPIDYQDLIDRLKGSRL